MLIKRMLVMFGAIALALFLSPARAQETITVGTTVTVPITFTSTLPTVTASFSITVVRGELVKLVCGGPSFTVVSSTSTSCVVAHSGGGATSGTLASVTAKASTAGLMEVIPEGTTSGILGGQVSGQLKGGEYIVVESSSTSPGQTSTSPSPTSNQTNSPSTQTEKSSETSTQTPAQTQTNAKTSQAVSRKKIAALASSFPQKLITLPSDDVELIFTPESFGGTPAGWMIIFPTVDTDVLFNFKALLKNGQVQVPESITLEKPVGRDRVIVTIPKNTTFSASNFDGTWGGPQTVPVVQQCRAQKGIDFAIEIGHEDTPLRFDKAVETTFVGKAKQSAGFCVGGAAVEVATACSETREAVIEQQGHCFETKNNSLTVASNHWTQFILFKAKLALWQWVAIAAGALLALLLLFSLTRRGNDVDSYVASVVHDLKTPLNAIKGYLSMILKGYFGPVHSKTKEPLHTIAGSAHQMGAIVNDILDVSKIKAGTIKINPSEFSIETLVFETVAALNSIAKEKGLAMKATGVQNVAVYADKDRVLQILTNLIGNALKFTQKGSVTITSRKKDTMIEVLVADTGPGIAVNEQARLFQKFSQVGSQKSQAAGTGLGLYISRELARKMGGDLWLEQSKLGTGSTFAFSLPIKKNVEQEP